MKTTEIAGGGGFGLGGLLFVLFVGLKLTGNINWSWLWVSSPLWLPIGVILALAIPVGLLSIWLERNR